MPQLVSLTAHIAAVLAKHERRGPIRNQKIYCSCGWSRSIWTMWSSKKAFGEHQAQHLVRPVATYGQKREREALYLFAEILDELASTASYTGSEQSMEALLDAASRARQQAQKGR